MIFVEKVTKIEVQMSELWMARLLEIFCKFNGCFGFENFKSSIFELL